jgi:hypothetical protein
MEMGISPLPSWEQPAEARAAFEKYLELQPNSKFAQDVRDKMNALR